MFFVYHKHWHCNSQVCWLLIIIVRLISLYNSHQNPTIAIAEFQKRASKKWMGRGGRKLFARESKRISATPRVGRGGISQVQKFFIKQDTNYKLTKKSQNLGQLLLTASGYFTLNLIPWLLANMAIDCTTRWSRDTISCFCSNIFRAYSISFNRLVSCPTKLGHSNFPSLLFKNPKARAKQ